MTNEELAVLIQSGEQDRLPELWSRVEKLVARKAKHWMVLYGGFGGVTFDDLYNSGYLAMVAAVDNFDPATGYKFTTYLSLPLKTAFAVAGGYRTKRQSLDPFRTATSLDTPLGDDEDGATLGDLQEDPAAAQAFEDVEEAVFHQQLHDALEKALNSLPEEQADTLRAHYYQGKTYREIGPQARDLEYHALRKLRHPKISRELRQYLEDRTPYYSGVGLGAFQRGGSQPERLTILREKWMAGGDKRGT